MTGAPSLDLRESVSRAALRWGACLAAVLLAHGAIAAGLLAWPEPTDWGAAPAPPILIDLAEPAPPAPQQATIQDVSKLLPEPDMPEPPAPMRNPVLDMAPTPEPPPEVKIEVTIEIPPPEPPPPVDLKPPPPKIVHKPPPPKPPEKVVAKQTAPSSAPPSPAPSADKPAGAPAPSDMPKPNPRAIKSWGDSLMAHLQRYKRYPSAARRIGLQGMPVVVFTVARNGTVLSVHLQKGSGHEMLDTEAVDLFRRASPLPAMPADVPGDSFQYAMPVEFSLR